MSSESNKPLPGFEGVDRPESSDWALKQFDTLSRYLAYENQAYWARFQAFASLHVGFLAVFGGSLAAMYAYTRVELGILALVVCAAAFLLAMAWQRTMTIAERWTGRWHSRLKDIEPFAFGTVDVFNNADEVGSLTTVGRRVPVVVCVLWAVAFATTVCLLHSGVG